MYVYVPRYFCSSKDAYVSMNISNIFSWMMRVKWKISKRMFVTLFTKKWIVIRNMQRVLLFLINKNWRKSGGKGWNELVLMILKKKKKKNVSVSCEKRNTCIFKKEYLHLGDGEKIEYRDNFVRKFFSFRNFQRHTCFWNNVCVFFNFNEESMTV